MRNCPDRLSKYENELVYDLSHWIIALAGSEQARRAQERAQRCSESSDAVRVFFLQRITAITETSREKIEPLLQQKPIFYKNEPNAEQKIEIDDEVMRLLPEDFFKDPTGWIESQPNIGRGEEGISSIDSITQLFDVPYDASKVKEINLGSVKIVSKRISDPKEIMRAMRAYNAGIPTPRVLGVIIDKGNLYAFFEKINGLNLNAVSEKWKEAVKAEGRMVEFLPLFWEAYERVKQWGKRSMPSDSNTQIWTDVSDVSWIYRYMAVSLGFNFAKSPKKDATDEAIKGFIQSSFHCRRDGLSVEQMFCGYSLYLDRISDVNGFVGFNITKETGKLEAMCRQKRMLHKDFEDRNIMIPWDFESDRPVKPEDGKPRLYVIDWESPADPEYDPIKLDFLWLQLKISWKIFNATA